MEYWKMKTLLMVAFLGLNRVNSRLTVTPSDVEVLNGTWVTLNCSTDSTSPIVWVKEDEGGFNNKTVFNGSSIAAEFNTSYFISRPKRGSFNLEFLATEKTESVYRCENEGDSASAKLDIIESPGKPIMSERRGRSRSSSSSNTHIIYGGGSENTVTIILVIVGIILGIGCIASFCKTFMECCGIDNEN